MIDAWRFADIEEGTPMANRVFYARGDIESWNTLKNRLSPFEDRFHSGC